MDYSKESLYAIADLNNDESDVLHEYVKDAMALYLIHGIMPGGFMTSVLSNDDLYTTVSRADMVNIKLIGFVTRWLLNNAPAGSYGSFEAVEHWKDDINGIRSQYVKMREKEVLADILTE